MKKFDVSILTVSVLLVGLAVIGVSQAKEPKAESNEAVVAKVGTTTFTQTQVYEAMKAKSGPSVMTQMVLAELIRQEAKAKNVTVTDQELDAMINPIKEKMGTPEKFQEYLKGKGVDEPGLRDRTALIMLRDKLIAQAYPVTEEQIKEYFAKNKDKLETPNPTLESARAEIIDNVTSKNRRAHMDEWIDGLHKKYQVQLFDPELEETDKE